MKNYSLRQILIAEFIGTFILVFIGTGLIIIDNITGGKVTNFGIALGFGVAVTISIFLVGRISGANINPAITLSFVLMKKIERKNLVVYWFPQVLGAIFASYILKLSFGNVFNLGATIPQNGVIVSFSVEILVGFILMYMVCLVSFNEKLNVNLAPIIIGATVFFLAFVAGPISGGSINPARSIGPALMSGNISNLWIYVTAPFFGFTLAATAFQKINKRK